MESIYSLNKQLESILNIDADEQAVKDTLESLGDINNQKCVDVMMYVKHLDGQAAQVKEEVARLNNLKKSYDSKIETMKSFVLYNMKARDLGKIESALLSISYVKPKPMLLINDEKKIDRKYKIIKTVVSFDKKALLADLKNKETVEGCEIGESKAGLKY